MCYSQLGAINLAIGKHEDARHYFAPALTIAKELFEREPDRIDLRRDLSISYERLAATDPARARELLEQAIEISRDNVTRDPGNAWNLRVLAVQLAQLAESLTLSGEHDEARPFGREALSLLESLDIRGALDARCKSALAWLASRFTESKS